MTGAEQHNGATVETAATPLLEIENLSVHFPGPHGLVRAVDEVSWSMDTGETLGLVGESGSGKSVTALSILGLLPANARIAGSVRFEGVELLGRRQRWLNRIRGKDIAMVFQEPMTSLNPAFTVGEQIAEVVRTHTDRGRRGAWERAVEVLDFVGVPSAGVRANAYPHEFSGGMRQRVMIAMALACEPKLLIADEPTTALDVTMQDRVLDLLGELQQRMGMAVLLVTHDLGVVAETCENVVVMYAGQVVERTAVRDAFNDPHHPYTHGLLESMPQRADLRAPLPFIAGVVPPPNELPAGCRFHPRCELAVEGLCDTDAPDLYAVGASWTRCVRAEELDLKVRRI